MMVIAMGNDVFLAVLAIVLVSTFVWCVVRKCERNSVKREAGDSFSM